MIDATEQQFLRAVFCLSGAARPFSVKTVERVAGLTPSNAALALLRLGDEGLIDTDRMRLTMTGLALAATLEHEPRAERRERIRTRVWLRSRAAARLSGSVQRLVH